MSSAWKNVGMATIKMLIRTEIRTPAVILVSGPSRTRTRPKESRQERLKEGVKK